MKTIKILLIILIPAFGFVGCKKSSCQPHDEMQSQHDDKGGHSSDDKVVNKIGNTDNSVEAADDASQQSGNRLSGNGAIPDDGSTIPNNNNFKLYGEGDDENGLPVVGSGDDDRDGGDRKQKKAGR